MAYVLKCLFESCFLVLDLCCTVVTTRPHDCIGLVS